jgi:putative ABC transport system permease protein
MGKIVLICRLAARDLRRRPAQAGLLLLVIMAATATLSLGLALRGVASQPYEQTRAATKGPDVVATIGVSGQQVSAQVSALLTTPGVTGHRARIHSHPPSCGQEAGLRSPWRKGVTRRPHRSTSPH